MSARPVHTAGIGRDEILALLVARTAAVLAVPHDRVHEATRFGDDLLADSLDLVEIVESVERALRARGVTATIPDTELVRVATLGDAATRLAELATPLGRSA